MASEQELSAAVLEQMSLPMCNGFKLLPVALEQIVTHSVGADAVACGTVDIAGAGTGDEEGAVAHGLGVDVVAHGTWD